MTEAQLRLLRDLKASSDRGASSMGCSRRLADAEVLRQLGCAERHGTFMGDFYCITLKGFDKLKETSNDA